MSEAVSSAAITQEQLAVLKSSEWFAALEPAFQQAMLASSRVRVLAAGIPVFHRGDPNDGIYCILSGAIRCGAVAPSGRESMVALIKAPEWFGEIALFDSTPAGCGKRRAVQRNRFGSDHLEICGRK
jgi:CRP/FNR family transcriptional regulator, cyclic AMP receptor protein